MPAWATACRSRVKYPMHECRGFDAGCPTLASSRPVFVAISMEGSDPLVHVNDWHTNVGTLLLLPRGTIYPGTPKQYSVVSVRRTGTVYYLFGGNKSGNELSACGRRA